jgi:hypothetical protein
MPRTTFETDGRIFYRTKLMSADRALSFVSCLSKNSAFAQVEAVWGTNCKPGQMFVQFRPASVEAQTRQFATEQNKRVARAATEGTGYVFVASEPGFNPRNGKAGYYYCLSTSGEVYEVNHVGCTCPDYRFRCDNAGLLCKHQIACRNAINEGRIMDWHELYGRRAA